MGTRNVTRDVNAAERAAMALSLRAQRMTYDEIAKACGYADRGACHNAVMRELERTVVENVEDLRREECASLDTLEEVCWKRLNDPEYAKAQMFAVDRIIAIKERRARLMGLDIKTEDQIGPQIIIQEVPHGYLEGPKP